jgi:hypothetical protein
MEVGKAHEQERKRWTQIAKALVEKAKKPDVLDRVVVEKIITTELMNIWNATPKETLAKDLKDSLLHRAVSHQKSMFVKQFLEEDKESVTKKYKLDGSTEPKFPLWYNNHPKR